ncbi:spore coat protein (plasmid) [Pseudalkalibacillus hwajinpoensis]|uniref:spore coat protein n=1 Tax=Guptibacillus hwajinpoensis TaxID=208199 RepID=UPI00325A68CC
MSDLQEALSNGWQKGKKNRMMDILLSDIFQRHGVSNDINLTDTQKQKIKDIFSDIQKQVEEITKK